MIKYEYIKPAYEAHKKGDSEGLEKNVQRCLMRLKMHENKPDFKKIAADALRELQLWLERFYFAKPKFVKKVISLARRYVNQITN